MQLQSDIQANRQQINSSQIKPSQYDKTILGSLLDVEELPISNLELNQVDGTKLVLKAEMVSDSIRFQMKRKLESKSLYENQRQLYNQLVKDFGEEESKLFLPTLQFNDKDQELIYQQGSCTLGQMAQYFKRNCFKVPAQLISQVFRSISGIVKKLALKNFFFDNITPDTILIEFLGKKQAQWSYIVKVFDYSSITQKMSIQPGFSPKFVLSPVITQDLEKQKSSGDQLTNLSPNQDSIKLETKTQNQLLAYQSKIQEFVFPNQSLRLRNQYFSLARLVQYLMLDDTQGSKDAFDEIDCTKSGNQNVNMIIARLYKTELEKDKILPKLLKFIQSQGVDYDENLNAEIEEQFPGSHVLSNFDFSVATLQGVSVGQHKKENLAEAILSMQCRICLKCEELMPSEVKSDLNADLDNFLLNRDQVVYLLLGKAGSGKSKFLLQHYTKLKHLRDQIINSEAGQTLSDFCCFHIKLCQFAKPERKQFFIENIQEIINETKQTSKIILYLDGFDEFGANKERIMEYIGIDKNPGLQKRFKLIVSCRSTEITGHMIENIFRINNQMNLTRAQLISSLNQEQLSEYLKKFVKATELMKKCQAFSDIQSLESPDDYFKFFHIHKEIKEMVTELKVVRTLAGIIPSVGQVFNGRSHFRINIFELFSRFTHLWLEDEIARHADTEKIGELVQIKECASPHAIKQYLIEKLLDIIEYLWIHQKISCNLICKEDLESLAMSGKSANYNLVLKFYPISISNENQFQFMHKLLLDYYLALFWSKDITLRIPNELQGQDPQTVENCKELKDMYISKQFILEDAWPSLIILSDHVLHNLVEGDRKQTYEQIIDVCLQILFQSKQVGYKMIQASSNAMTILNFLSFDFSGMDLSKIKAQNACLDGANFFCTNLQHAELEGCNLSKANLDFADLSRANLSGINIGIEFPDLQGHIGEVPCVAVTYDQKFIVSGGQDCKLIIWNLHEKKMIKALNGHTGKIYCIALTNDSKYIASGSFDKTIIIWSLGQLEKIHSLTGHKDAVRDIAAHPNNQKLISASWDFTVKIWDIQKGALEQTLEMCSDKLDAVAISPNGSHIVAGCRDRSIKIWDSHNSKPRSLLKHTKEVKCVVISGDSTKFYSGSRDQYIFEWDLVGHRYIRTFSGRVGQICALDLSKDGSILIGGTTNWWIVAWSTQTGEITQQITDYISKVRSVKITEDNKFIVSTSADNIIKVQRLTPWSQARHMSDKSAPVVSLDISNDQKYFVTAGLDEQITLWDLQTKLIIRKYVQHTQRITSVLFSKDNKHILSGSLDKSVMLWEIENGQLAKQFSEHLTPVMSIAMSPSSNHIISGGEDGLIMIRERKQKKIHKIKCQSHLKQISSMAVTPECQYLVSGSHDKTIKLWSLASGSLVHTFTEPNSEIISVCVSKNGKQIIAAAKDGLIFVADIGSKSSVRSFPVFQDKTKEIMSMCLFGESKCIVMCVRDRVLQIWDFANSKMAGDLSIISSYNGQVVASTDCRMILCGCNRQMKIWTYEQFNEQQQLLKEEDGKGELEKVVFNRSISPRNRAWIKNRYNVQITVLGQFRIASCHGVKYDESIGLTQDQIMVLQQRQEQRRDKDFLQELCRQEQSK